MRNHEAVILPGTRHNLNNFVKLNNPPALCGNLVMSFINLLLPPMLPRSGHLAQLWHNLHWAEGLGKEKSFLSCFLKEKVLFKKI